jgi:hypothetical protein
VSGPGAGVEARWTVHFLLFAEPVSAAFFNNSEEVKERHLFRRGSRRGEADDLGKDCIVPCAALLEFAGGMRQPPVACAH